MLPWQSHLLSWIVRVIALRFDHRRSHLRYLLLSERLQLFLVKCGHLYLVLLGLLYSKLVGKHLKLSGQIDRHFSVAVESPLVDTVSWPCGVDVAHVLLHDNGLRVLKVARECL